MTEVPAGTTGAGAGGTTSAARPLASVPTVAASRTHRTPESARTDEERPGVISQLASFVTMPAAPTDLASPVAEMAGPWMAPPLSAPPAGTTADRTSNGAGAVSAASDLAQQEAIVREVLAQYARAFERLDVQAAKAIWPTLDARALRRAFHQLDSQQLRFTSCGVSISGQAANAHCRGDATYQPKVGARPMHFTSRKWNFNLSRHEDGWHIVDATIQ